MSENERIAEIRARLKAATPGEWDYVLGSGNIMLTAIKAEQGDGRSVFIADCLPDYALDWAERDHRPNMEFVANAPADLAYLLAENARIDAALAGQEQAP